VETSIRTDLITGDVAGSAAGGRRTRRDRAPDLILRPGAKLANSRGVPGTLGTLAVSRHDKAVGILTSQHVLCGAGAQFGEPVWLTADPDGGPRFVRVGLSRYGRIGTVERGGSVHVDCAIATVDGWHGPPPGWRVVPEAEPDREQPLAGRAVWAVGGVSGRSHGVVTGPESWAGASSGQFLVRSREPRRPFSVEGDSGAVVRDKAGSPVGLIWGTTPSGASIATPIWAVVDVLGLQLVQLVRLIDVAKSDRRNDDMQVRMLP
jgi:hypothetical protein